MPGVPPRFLFLISVSSSDAAARGCREIAIPESPETDVLVVCGARRGAGRSPEEGWPGSDGQLPRPSTHRPMGGRQRGEVRALRMETGKRIIRVDTISYELVPGIRAGQDRDEEGAPPKRNANSGIRHEAKAVKLHHTANYSETEPNAGRHSSVYLDTIELAKHINFRQKCIAQLQKSKTPT